MLSAIGDLGNGVLQWRTSYKLGVQDIDLRYRRSVLGPFWISASLVATVLALAFVFGEVFRQDFVDYVIFLGAGLLAWQLILALVNEGCGSIAEHSAFLQNLRMPLSVIAGRIVFRNAIVFVHNLIAIVGVFFLFGAHLTWTALWVFPAALMILAIGYFLILVLGPICARFRDIPLVVQSAMQVIFFMTPIFWQPSAMAHRPMLTLANPIYHWIELVRAPLLGHEATWLNWQVAFWSCGVACLLAIITLSVTRKRLSLWL
ncbi:MAG: ABC transporter permease [Caulobacterales bacterium]|jgi:ABC-type polysaccharide/polyol phosphate export permease|nr:ABC transporter permease [Caulobacterales bacterium]